MPATPAGQVRVRVYVERAVNERAIMFLDVDENEDQWTTFERAAGIADQQNLWTRLESEVSKTRSEVQVMQTAHDECVFCHKVLWNEEQARAHFTKVNGVDTCIERVR